MDGIPPDASIHARMGTLGDSPSLYHPYQLLLSTNPGLPLQPFPIKTDSLSYPSPTAPIAAQIPLISSPSNVYETPSSHSSPPHSSALSINTKSSSIHLDAKFHSFEEFRCTLDEWMSLNYHPFRVASSEMLRESEGTLNETFRYRYIVYHCAHYGKPRRRGAGKRPNQNYLPCECTANLRLNYSFTDKCLKITTLKTEHTNHVLSAEAFEKCAIKVKKSPSENTPIAPKKGKKRAASSSTDDSGVGISPMTKRIKGETHSPPSAFSPLHSSTPPSETTNESENTSSSDNTKEEDFPAPPPNLPAPTPQRPPTTYNNILPFLMAQPSLFLNNLSNPLFNFTSQSPLNIMQPSSMEAQFTFKFNEAPIVTPIDSSSDDKENSGEFIDVENERVSSPQEYATLQPVKSLPSQVYEPSNLQHTINSLQAQLLNGDPELTSIRQAELNSLISKWGAPTPSI